MTATRWPMVALGEVLRPADDPVPVNASQSYPNLGLLAFGRGVFEKPDIDGLATSANTLYRVRSGQFIYSRLFAFEGAFSIVPPKLDGFFVSNEFPVFDIIESKMVPGFVRWIFRQPDVWRAAASRGVGMGDRRRRVHPEALLTLLVPLPPLAEQARIVARLDGAAERLERRAAAAKAVEAELDATLRAAFRRAADGRSVRLGELLTLRPTDTTVLPHETYQFAGVYSFARGVFRSVIKKGSETSYQYLTRLTKGDFVYPKLMAWEGALGVVPDGCDGCYVSPEFPVFSVDINRVAPEILELHFRDPTNWPTSTGTNVRRKRVKPEEFLNLQIPLPDPGAQATLAAACCKAKAALAAQRAATEHLDKLLPAMLHEAFGETASAEPLAAE